MPVWAGEATGGIETTYPEHTRGVQLARAGHYEEGLGVLLPLLARFPEDYPLQRDVILITLWKGDCPGALKRFERVRHRPDLEPYLVVPLNDCLLAANRPNEARRLTRLAHERHQTMKVCTMPFSRLTSCCAWTGASTSKAPRWMPSCATTPLTGA